MTMNTLENYIEDLRWNRLGLQPSKMLKIVASHDMWRLSLELMPLQLLQT